MLSRKINEKWSDLKKDEEGKKLIWMMEWNPFKSIFKHFCKPCII